MYKSLDIGIYENGISVAEMNCIDLPIAAASGSYNGDNYFHYSFYYCMLMNWCSNINNDYIGFKNDILNKMGLRIKEYSINCSEELLLLIKNKIDEQVPVLIIPTYSSIFCCEGYMKEEGHIPHGLIVSSYDTDRPVFIIREPFLLDYSNHDEIVAKFIDGIDGVYKGYTFYKLQITESMLLDIWEKSSMYSSEFFRNRIFCLEETYDKGKSITNNIDVIRDIIQNYKFNSDNVLYLLNNYEILKQEYEAQKNRRIFVKSIESIFKFIRYTFNLSQSDSNERNMSFFKFQNNFIKYRTTMFNRLYIYSSKNIKLTSKERSDLEKEVIANEEDFIENLKSLYYSYVNGDYPIK